MSDRHDAWFFIGIFAFIFVIWIAVGGPLHPISFTAPSFNQPTSSGAAIGLPRAPFAIGNSSVSLGGGSSSGSSGAPVPTFTGGSTFGAPSIYRGIVTMDHYVSGAASSNPDNEYVEIRVDQNANLPVDITGWTLSSDASGNAVVIPQGTEVPTSGTINAAQDIVLTPGVNAIIVSGQSPIGASFRENKCIGYFSSFQQFSPSLPQNCPRPSDELASLYGTGYIRDAACIDYVDNLSRCQVALTPPTGASSACQTFLEKYMNYNGCVTAHQSDADFKGDTWRVYLGRSNSMWRSKDELVKLLDKDGKTVDAFSY